MDHNHRIVAAVADLQSQYRPNIACTAKRHGVGRKTLADLVNGKSTPMQEANSSVRQRLTDAQEDTLIEYINKLSGNGFSPTPQILRNIAENIVKSNFTGLQDINANCISRSIESTMDQSFITHQRRPAIIPAGTELSPQDEQAVRQRTGYIDPSKPNPAFLDSLNTNFETNSRTDEPVTQNTKRKASEVTNEDTGHEAKKQREGSRS